MGLEEVLGFHTRLFLLNIILCNFGPLLDELLLFKNNVFISKELNG